MLIPESVGFRAPIVTIGTPLLIPQHPRGVRESLEKIRLFFSALFVSVDQVAAPLYESSVREGENEVRSHTADKPHPVGCDEFDDVGQAQKMYERSSQEGERDAGPKAIFVRMKRREERHRNQKNEADPPQDRVFCQEVEEQHRVLLVGLLAPVRENLVIHSTRMKLSSEVLPC